MGISIKQLAMEFSLTENSMMNLLKEHAIMINDVTSELSAEELRKINDLMKNNHSENARENRAKSDLEYYIKNYKIFIDCCSLLNFASEKFWENVKPIVQETGNKIIVPLRVYEEVIKHSKNKNDLPLSETAKATLIVLKQLKEEDLIEIRGEKTDNFADNVFLVVFTKFRMQQKLMLITQDVKLALDILNLNKTGSVRACAVSAKKINQYGFLSDFSDPKPSQGSTSSANSYKSDNQEKKVEVKQNTNETTVKKIEEEIFQLRTTVTSVSNIPIRLSYMPREGDTLQARKGNDKKEIKLGRCIGTGGEAKVYDTNTEFVAKIYECDKNNKRKEEKIKLMLSKNIKCKGICYPVAALYNPTQNFVGYLMPRAKGIELQKSLFLKPLFLKAFPNWRKCDIVNLCITILEKIKYLHEHNIILGDINAANILIVSPQEVYFVDTDSYQVEDFPCPVGTISFTAQEILIENAKYKKQNYKDREYDQYLRTFQNEYFSVTVLLFMLMLPGKNPYSLQGGESMADNMLKMDFAYPFGEQSNKKTPDGPWKFIWSHLTYDIKEAFYQSFRMDGERNKDGTRISVDEWLGKFKYYLLLLSNGTLEQQDEMSLDIFPIRHKKSSKVTYTICEICRLDVPEDSCKNGICQECLNKGEVYPCNRCGKEILFTNYHKYVKNSRKYDICQECFDYNNSIYTSLCCIDCGEGFDVTNGDNDFFSSKGYSLPKRCNTCRERKKNASNLPKQTPTTKSKGSKCFITSAACEYMNKEDDCYELETIRDFRDGWLINQPDGKTLVSKYYVIAPMILPQLNASSLKAVIYSEIWSRFIKQCVEHIEKSEYYECKTRYTEMINYLTTIFLDEGVFYNE